MAIKLSNKDYLWSYVGILLSLLSSVIMTPFGMYFLDEDSFGLWGIFQSLAAITTLFDFGFSTTFSRNINYCWNGAVRLKKTGAVYSSLTEPNFYLMKKTMTACRTVFLILSTSAFVLLGSMGTVYIVYISAPIGGVRPVIAWLIYALAVFLNLYFGYYGSFLRGVGAISDVNKATVYTRIIQILLTVILLWIGCGLIGTSIAYLAYGTLYRQFSKNRFYKFKGIGKGLKAVSAQISNEEVKESFFIVWHNAWREGLVSLSNYLANQACTVICSIYLSLPQTGTYSLAVQLATAVSQVSAVMYTANQPVLQSAHINNDEEKKKRTMSLIVVSYVVLNIVGLFFIIAIGLPILRLIKPNVVVGAGMMIGIGLYQFVLKFRNCYTSYFSCTNRIPYVKAFVLSALICVFLALISMGIFKLGVWGLILSQLVSQCIYNAWAWAVKAHRELKLSFNCTVKYGFEEMKIIFVSVVKNKDKSAMKAG